MNLMKCVKPVEWQSHGKARLPKADMESAVTGLINALYGIPKADLLPLTKMYEWGSFYRADGAKITKSLQTIVRKFKTKEETAASFPDLGRVTSELYEPSATYVAEFVDKNLIGEGTLEGKKTCFHDGGINGHNKHFLVLHRRIGMLKITDKEKRGVARCLVFFAGYRNVFLFNFYFNGVTQNKHLFIEAYRRLMKLKKVMYKETEQGGFFLPIYRNTRHAASSPIPTLHLYDEKSRFPKIVRKMPCPYCRTEVLETELWADMRNTEKYGACTKTCFLKATGRLITCGICNKEVERDRSHEILTSRTTHPIRYQSVIACKLCTETTAQMCVRCSRVFHKSCMTEDSGGSSVCKECLINVTECHHCGGKYTRRGYVNVATPEGSRKVCEECAPLFESRCDVCRGSYSYSKTPLRIDGVDVRVCTTCREVFKGFRIDKSASL